MSKTTPINCEEALRLLAEFLDGELGTLDDTAVRHHLDHCRSCYSRAEFEKRLKAQVSALAAEPVSTSLDQRVRELLNAFRANQPGE